MFRQVLVMEMYSKDESFERQEVDIFFYNKKQLNVLIVYYEL